MTLVTLPSLLFYPGMVAVSTNAPSPGTWATLSSAGHHASVIIKAREAMTISHVYFRAGASTGSPTLDVRIETVGSTGIPSGTLWATNTNLVTGTLTSSSDNLIALTASASIARGDTFAVKLAYNSGTSQVVQNAGSNWVALSNSAMPYTIVNAGSDTKNQMVSPFVGVGSSATSFYCLSGMIPANAAAGNTFNNSVAGAKRGVRFQVPFACRAVGMKFYNSNLTGDFNAILMDDSGAELSSSSTAYDGDTSAGATYPWLAYFDNNVSLSANTWYRAVIEPTTTTNCNITTLTTASADYRGATPGGAFWNYTTFTTGGGWVESTTAVPLVDIIVDQIDDGTGSGSGGGGQRVISG